MSRAPAALPAQTKKGKKAKSTVEQEFVDVMKILVQKATAECDDKGTTPFFVYDNNSTQAKAKPRVMGMGAGQYLSITPNSPDFNKPVEHTFHQIKKKLHNKMYAHSGEALTPEMAQHWVLEAFEAVKTTSLHKDIHSMPDTWSIVSKRKDESFTTSKGEQVSGTEGGYAEPAGYR
jgi:hypothetical protein